MYLVAHNVIFTEKNIKIKFKSTGILFWDLNFIIFKLNMYLHMPTFLLSCLSFSCYWELQIPKTKKQMHLQFHLINNRIFTYQKNFFIFILKIVN